MAGRSRKFSDWTKKDKLIVIAGWKLKGVTDKQVATNIGITQRTLDRWKNRSRPLCLVLKRSKERVNFVVENQLLKQAMAGNLTAIIFYLKNNYRVKYSDNSEYISDEINRAKLRKLKAGIDKTKAEARIKNYQANRNDASKNKVVNQTSEILSKLEKASQPKSNKKH